MSNFTVCFEVRYFASGCVFSIDELPELFGRFLDFFHCVFFIFLFCFSDCFGCFVSEFDVCLVICACFVDSVVVPGIVSCVDGCFKLCVEPGCSFSVFGVAGCVWDVFCGEFLDSVCDFFPCFVDIWVLLMLPVGVSELGFDFCPVGF